MSFGRRERRDNFDSKHDEEANKFNRLFIMGAKGATEEEFKTVFGEYGTVEDVRCVTDRNTGESRGITYITFSKASEACQALEEMNGKVLLHYPKPMKVVMASPRKEGNVRDDNEHEKLQRLFIMIPTTYDKDKLEEIFSEWGDIEYINVLKHRDTGKPKGLAYVKYYRAFHAAKALENCDRSFKALFADTTRQKPKSQSFSYSEEGYGHNDYGPTSYYSGSSQMSSTRNIRYGDPSTMRSEYSANPRGGLLDSPGPALADHKPASYYDSFSQPGASATRTGPDIALSSGGPSPLSLMAKVPHNDCRTLSFLASPQVTEQQMYDIFNIVPGFEKIQYNDASATGKVVFQSPQCAAWAQNKINGFEFPMGFRMQVTFDQGASKGPVQQAGIAELTNVITAAAMNLQSGGDVQSSIQQLAAAMQAATGTSRGGGMNSNNSISDVERVSYCNIPLPLPKGAPPRDSPSVERLFFVSQPDAFPEKYLRDVFCRFNGLQEVYFIPRKNFGYAKFSDKEGALRAVETLHGSHVCDMRMKVMVAEPESQTGGKRGGGYDMRENNGDKRFRRE